ncbi:MAG: hypothetical protein DWQ01_02845 [Planctomycetota bacterium]|nr:MAG: hypothetical protein DWQ01_02845 [Planctomycetota bacterium]
MKRLRRLVPLALLAVVTLGLSACNRNIGDDLDQKGQVLARDANHVYDTFSKHFLNHDPDDPYLD